MRFLFLILVSHDDNSVLFKMIPHEKDEIKDTTA